MVMWICIGRICLVARCASSAVILRSRTVGLNSFSLTQLAEHGVKIYLGSLYNNLDVVFCIIGFSWLGLRISGLVHHNQVRSDLSFDCLALGSVLLLPRCASALVQDNVVLLALRAMLGQFAFFMIIAAICFSGFLYAFYSLSDHTEWTFARIGWTLLKVWFGNNYVGFDTAQSFSPIFGPFLMVLFAVLRCVQT